MSALDANIVVNKFLTNPAIGNFYLDIETRPPTEQRLIDKLMLEIKPSAVLKDPEKIAADIAKKRSTALRDSCTDAFYGKVCMIGLHESKLGRCLMDDKQFSEEELLTYLFAAWVVAGRPTIVAHNGIKFDARFVYQRALILGVHVPKGWPYDAKPWDTQRIFDTSVAWGGDGFTSLNKLSQALDGPQKVDMGDGKWAFELLDEGRIDEAHEYLEGDLDCLIHVHRRETEGTESTESGHRIVRKRGSNTMYYDVNMKSWFDSNGSVLRRIEAEAFVEFLRDHDQSDGDTIITTEPVKKA